MGFVDLPLDSMIEKGLYILGIPDNCLSPLYQLFHSLTTYHHLLQLTWNHCNSSATMSMSTSMNNAAPEYNQSSLDGTTVHGHGNGNGKARSNDEEDLHRYVTDDHPRAQTMSGSGKPRGDGLIVSVV
jgi:hypothetical protein